MPYMTITRMSGTGEQRLLTRSAHEFQSLAQLKQAVAAAWGIQNANNFALDLRAGGFEGSVWLSKDEEWTFIRPLVENAIKPVILTMRHPPSRPMLADLEPRSVPGGSDRVAELEKELGVIKAQAHDLQSELVSVRSVSMNNIIEAIQTNARSSSDRVMSKITSAQQAQVTAQRGLTASVEEVHMAVVQAKNRIDEQALVILALSTDKAAQMLELKRNSSLIQAQAKEIEALKAAVTDALEHRPATPAAANASKTQTATDNSRNAASVPAARAPSSSFAEVD